jgi:glycosyltransferase involved in cell wall biosynthesis
MTAPPVPATPAQNKKPTMIVLSHLRWDFVFQRPQHLLSRAAAHFDVVFLEEPIHADETVPRLEIHERPGGIRVAQPMLPQRTDQEGAVAAQRAIVDELAARAGGSLVLWYYTPMALSFSRHLKADLVIFDKMDELSAFKNAPPLLLQLEAELLGRADIVFTGGASMHRAAAHRHANIHCFPSSIDAAHFAVARRGAADPADQASVGRPRLGFFGVIDERMDLALVAEVADRRPDWQLMMIGPVVKIDPGSLPQRANIHWLGGRAYDELPAYLANWDIGFMPFALNESTKFISPTKTPEFLAAGLPVVSTAITDVVTPYGDEGLVEIAASAEEAVAAVERLLAADRAPWLARVDARLAQGSWDRTWAAMRAQIAKKLPQAGDATRPKLSIRVAETEEANV